MTVSTTTRKAGPFTGNGVTTIFPFTFRIFAIGDVVATQVITATGVESTPVNGVDYTVSMNADQDNNPGGSATWAVAPPAGRTITLTTNLLATQSVVVTNAGGFFPAVFNGALDRLTVLIQQVQEQLGRTLKVSIGSGLSTVAVAVSPGGVLQWNGAGDALVATSISDLASSAALPAQAGKAGQFLTTNATIASWAPLTAANVNGALAYTAADAAALTLLTNRVTAVEPVVKGHLFGLTLSAAGATATFGIAAGQAGDTTGAALMTLATAYTKTTAAWALGTAAGALDTGAIANNGWYHVFLIRRPDTGVVDVLISLSATAPTLPTNYTQFRRIGSIQTNGSAQWRKFSQVGDEFLWDVGVLDYLNSTLGTVATLYPLTVPNLVRTTALFNCSYFNVSGSIFILFNSPDQAIDAAGAQNSSSGAATGITGVLPLAVRTNASSQIRIVTSAANTNISITTYGWIDRRGRDA